MKKIYNRYITKKLTAVSSKNKVKLLLGARQTGKSTLLKKIKKY